MGNKFEYRFDMMEIIFFFAFLKSKTKHQSILTPFRL